MRRLILVGVLVSLGAEHRTANFKITAPNAQIAEQMGKWAEHYRREKAEQWLGKEMPAWTDPCPLKVTVSLEPPQGKTSFTYNEGQLVGIDMEVQGPLDRLIYSVLPHEITHAILAQHFGCAVPRWADEGVAVLSEDKAERDRHVQAARKIFNEGQGFRLRALLSMSEYPTNGQGVMCLYAQGNSLTEYLIQRKDRAAFLDFVKKGIDARGWDQAVEDCYGFKSVDELEEAWLRHVRDGGRSKQIAARTQRPIPRSAKR